MSSPKILTLDVRTLLRAGSEPLTVIMQAQARLASGQTLRLLTTFEPRPLYALFESEGYKPQPRQLGADDWEILFVPEGSESANGQEMDFREQPTQDWLGQALEAASYLGREDKMVLHSSERPDALLTKLNTATTDYDCESEGDRHWVTTIWRL